MVLCWLHNEEGDLELARGQRYLELAAAPNRSDPYALASLADTLCGTDPARASDLYRQAFELNPTDAYPLVRYLEHEIGDRGNVDILDVIGPLADRAIYRCNAHVSVGVNLPGALHGKAELLLLMGKSYEELDSYARAIEKSTAANMIEDALAGLSMLTGATDRIVGLSWVTDLLALAARSRTEDGTESGIDREVGLNLHGPVVMVAGATDSEQEAEMERHRLGFIEAFSDFEGTVISGGTRNGISGLVGQLGAECSARITTVGYLPETAESSTADDRYSRLQRVGDGFSPQQSLQSWIDVIASGIKPGEVKVLGINGGTIAAAEYRIALALGATVGVVQGSGRAVDAILNDAGWVEAKSLLALPDDPQTLRAFVGSGSPRLPV